MARLGSTLERMSDATQLLNEFTERCIAWGNCHSSGNSNSAEPLRGDLDDLWNRIGSTGPNVQARLLELMRTHPNPWVRHCISAKLLPTQPREASAILEDLSRQDGMWALSSQVVLGSWRQRH